MAAEKAAAGGEWRGVHRLQNQVLEGVNQSLFGNGIVTPKDEDEVLAMLRKGADGGVGELFPAVTRVRGGLSGTHGICDSLLDPLLGSSFFGGIEGIVIISLVVLISTIE